MKVGIDPKGLILICIVPLWCELHHRCEFRLPKQLLDAFQDIPMENVERFTSNNDFILFELSPAWKAVDQPIELTRGLI